MVYRSTIIIIMKKYLLIAAAALIASCTSTPSIPPVQVEYQDGMIENVKNPEDITVKKGDSVIIRYYSSNISFYSTTELFGRYKGVLRNPTIDSMCLITYKVGVVIK